MKPLPGQDVYLRVVEQGGDGGVVSMLLQQAPGQVHHQLPPHHLVTVDTYTSSLHLSGTLHLQSIGEDLTLKMYILPATNLT